MPLSTDAIVAIVALFVSLPPSLLVLWRCYVRPHQRSTITRKNPLLQSYYFLTNLTNVEITSILQLCNALSGLGRDIESWLYWKKIGLRLD